MSNNWKICWARFGGEPVAFDIVTSPHGSVLPVVSSPQVRVGAPEWAAAELVAHANLIAAAPELLAAAKMAEGLIRDGGVVPIKGMSWVALATAISKAEGRS